MCPGCFRSIRLSTVMETLQRKEESMKIHKKILDFEYEEVLDARTRELIRVGCAVAVGCPT
jgi:alkylhydroperoxidase/carboxymuconolactone decarboxylase family protein YurZ